MIEELDNKIKNVVQLSYTTNPQEDTGNYPVVQVSYHEKAVDCEVIQPYGVYYNPPINCLSVMFNVNGESENKKAIFYDPQNRYKVSPGEVAFGAPAFGQKIYCKNNGDIIITGTNNKEVTITKDITVKSLSGQILLDAALVKCTGDFEVEGKLTSNNGSLVMENGDLTTSGDVTAGTISLKNHTHDGVTAGSDDTGVPNA
jgi:phage gp45-like